MRRYHSIYYLEYVKKSRICRKRYADRENDCPHIAAENKFTEFSVSSGKNFAAGIFIVVIQIRMPPSDNFTARTFYHIAIIISIKMQ